MLRAGKPVRLPRSKKTRALLAYLVATGREHRRDRLLELLWDGGEDRRALLRWSLSRLRQLLDEPGVKRIHTDGELVQFRPHGARIDVTEVLRASGADLDELASADLEAALGSVRGPFLEGLEQPDQHAYQAWCVAERERFRTLHVRLLEVIVERHREDVERALPHARELVRLAADSVRAWSSFLGVLQRAGHRAEAEEQYGLALRKLEKQGPLILQELRAEWQSLNSLARPTSAPEAQQPTRQRVHFCTARDGVRIAYASVGRGPPLVKTANWMNHLEYDWKSPIWRHLAEELSQRYTLVRYDQRGNGLSDWQVETFSFAAFVADLETVVEAAGLERFPLFGLSQGCAIAVEYAYRHPERVTRLVLLGGYVRGWQHRSAEELEERTAMLTLIRQGWGKENPALRQLFSSLFMPGATAEDLAGFNDLQRVSCSPENAVRISHANSQIDVSDRLEHIRVPTLVLHATGDERIPFDEGRRLAAGIPNARFVALESKNHLLLSHEPAWQRCLEEIRSFLAEESV